MLVLEELRCEPAKTKTVASVLQSLKLNGGRSLLVVDGADETLYRCSRNIPNLSIVPVAFLNAAQVLKSDNVILSNKELVGKLEEAVTL